MNRRDFLHPRRLAQSAGQGLAALHDLQTSLAAETEPHADPEVDLLCFSRRAMATQFEVILPFAEPGAKYAAETALDEIDRLESQLTVYQEDSEISRINRHAGTGHVPVEANLFWLLKNAARITNETQGAFDVTAGALIKAWGFFRRCHRVPSVDEHAQVLRRVGMQNVELNARDLTIRFWKAGLEINLGSIGKGYALDQAATLLKNEGITAGLMHGGHSSVLAIGTLPGNELGWPVGICHPGNTEIRLAMVWLRDRALATSAASFQNLEFAGRRLGHIIDPRTGWPAEGMASVTVLAPTAAEADALATAFFILGIDAARQYCASHPKISAILLPARGAGGLMIVGLSSRECVLASPIN